ncbi:hypothetical protein PFISCL1PPCAC_22973, partial [Pristionchus fissidentatus]
RSPSLSPLSFSPLRRPFPPLQPPKWASSSPPQSYLSSPPPLATGDEMRWPRSTSSPSTPPERSSRRDSHSSDRASKTRRTNRAMTGPPPRRDPPPPRPPLNDSTLATLPWVYRSSHHYRIPPSCLPTPHLNTVLDYATVRWVLSIERVASARFAHAM